MIEAVGGGSDTVFTNVSYALAAGQEIEFLKANGGTNLTLTGNEFANTITGWSGNDTISGGDGNDVISGLTGADTMNGGQGDDTFYVDNVGDVVNETAGQGADTVYAAVNWTLTAGSEVEILRANAGATGLTLTGNELANQIFGGTGNDTLNGGDGSDTLTGGTGADRLTGGLALDKFVFNSAAEIGSGASRDVIADWTSGETIDLSKIDANTTTAGDQAFTFVGTGAFSGAKGELHFVQDAAHSLTLVEGDANGDKAADFQLELTGVQTLHSTDFVL